MRRERFFNSTTILATAVASAECSIHKRRGARYLLSIYMARSN